MKSNTYKAEEKQKEISCRKCCHMPALNNGQQNVLHRKEIVGEKGCRTVQQHMEIQSTTEKTRQETMISSPKKNRKTSGGALQLPAASESAECFLRIRLQQLYGEILWRKFRKGKAAWRLYLPNNNNKVFCFLPVPLFTDNETAVLRCDPR